MKQKRHSPTLQKRFRERLTLDHMRSTCVPGDIRKYLGVANENHEAGVAGVAYLIQIGVRKQRDPLRRTSEIRRRLHRLLDEILQTVEARSSEVRYRPTFNEYIVYFPPFLREQLELADIIQEALSTSELHCASEYSGIQSSRDPKDELRVSALCSGPDLALLKREASVAGHRGEPDSRSPCAIEILFMKGS